MNTELPSTDLIEATVADLNGVISRLVAEREDIDSRLEELRARCRDWEYILTKAGQNGHTHRRARKGENDQRIAKIYQERPGQGFTLPKLAEITGISWSSVRNVVNKNGNGKYEERDGKWYHKVEKL